MCINQVYVVMLIGMESELQIISIVQLEIVPNALIRFTHSPYGYISLTKDCQTAPLYAKTHVI